MLLRRQPSLGRPFVALVIELSSAVLWPVLCRFWPDRDVCAVSCTEALQTVRLHIERPSADAADPNTECVTPPRPSPGYAR